MILADIHLQHRRIATKENCKWNGDAWCISLNFLLGQRSYRRMALFGFRFAHNIRPISTVLDYRTPNNLYKQINLC